MKNKQDENKPVRVVSYCRISTISQENNTSIPQQEESIKQYCLSRGFELVKTYRDTASGSSMDRPAFRLLETELYTDNIDGIIVHKLDRLSRSLIDARLFTDKLLKDGKFFLAITEGIDTSQASGKLLYNMLLVIAEAERDAIASRMAEGKKHLLSQGRFPSSYCYGYRRSAKGGNFVVIPEESDTIQQIFSSYLDTESIGQVERLLEQQQIRTRKDKRFSRQSILNVLRHEIYATGQFRWNGELVDSETPTVISKQKWNRTQRLLNSKSRKLAS